MFKKNKAFVILSIIYSVFLFTSCTISPIDVKQVNDIQVKNINNNKILLEITATINNPNPRIKIKNSELFLYMKDSEIGKITQTENIVLLGKQTGTYTTKINLEITNLAGGLTTAYKLLGKSKLDLKLSGKVRISTLLFYRTIKIKDFKVFK